MLRGDSSFLRRVELLQLHLIDLLSIWSGDLFVIGERLVLVMVVRGCDSCGCSVLSRFILGLELVGLLEVEIVLIRRRNLSDMDSCRQVASILPCVFALVLELVEGGTARETLSSILRVLLTLLWLWLSGKLLVAPLVRNLMLLMRKLLCALLHNHCSINN